MHTQPACVPLIARCVCIVGAQRLVEDTAFRVAAIRFWTLGDRPFAGGVPEQAPPLVSLPRTRLTEHAWLCAIAVVRHHRWAERRKLMNSFEQRS